MFEESPTFSRIPSKSYDNSYMMSRKGGSLVGGYEFVWTSHDITWVFLLFRFSIVFESLAVIMYFDLHLFFRKFVCFLYQVKDSDKCFDDSVLKCFTSVLIFPLIIFVRSEIVLFLKFTNFISFSLLLRKNSFSSTRGDCRWDTICSESG